MYVGEPPQNRISFGGQVPYSAGSPSWCSRNPSVPAGIAVRGCIQLQWIFSKTLIIQLPISCWVIYECTCPHALSIQQFLTKKRQDPQAPPSLFILYCPKELFFLFPWMKISSQRETFCQCGKGETKSGRSTKRHQNRQVKKLFWAGYKKVSIGVLHQMESTLKVTEV